MVGIIITTLKLIWKIQPGTKYWKATRRKKRVKGSKTFITLVSFNNKLRFKESCYEINICFEPGLA